MYSTIRPEPEHRATTSRRGRRARAMWSTSLVLVAGRRDAERDAADAADEQRAERQLERGRQPLPQVRRDRLLGPERRPEVAGATGCCRYVTYCSMMPPSSPHRSLAAATTSSLFMFRSPTIDASGSAGMIRGDDERDRDDAEQQQRRDRQPAQDVAGHASTADRSGRLSRCRAHPARGCSRRCSARR